MEARLFIIINFFLLLFLIGCTKIIPMKKLVFKDCKIYFNNKLFTGKYDLFKGDKYILSISKEGEIKIQKTFKNNILLMEKKYDSCDSGIQKNYDSKGNKISEGNFVKRKRFGNWKYFIKDSIYLIKY